MFRKQIKLQAVIQSLQKLRKKACLWTRNFKMFCWKNYTAEKIQKIYSVGNTWSSKRWSWAMLHFPEFILSWTSTSGLSEKKNKLGEVVFENSLLVVYTRESAYSIKNVLIEIATCMLRRQLGTKYSNFACKHVIISGATWQIDTQRRIPVVPLDWEVGHRLLHFLCCLKFARFFCSLVEDELSLWPLKKITINTRFIIQGCESRALPNGVKSKTQVLQIN